MDFLDFVRKQAQEQKERFIAKHYGPGPHKGTGTPQKIHAGARQRKGTPRGRTGARALYNVGGKKVEERRLLHSAISAQKELLNYQRGKKLSVKSKKRLEDANDALAQARYSTLLDPKRREKFERAAKVVGVFEKGGAMAVAFKGVPGVTG